MLAAAASGGISANAIVAACAVFALAISAGAAWYTVSKDKADKETKKAEKVSSDHVGDQTEISELRELVNRFMIAMFGQSADRKTGLPKIDGFVDEQRAHNVKVDKTLAELTTEITTQNGGGTIKGSLMQLRTEVGAVSGQVAELKGTVEQQRSQGRADD